MPAPRWLLVLLVATTAAAEAVTTLPELPVFVGQLAHVTVYMCGAVLGLLGLDRVGHMMTDIARALDRGRPPRGGGAVLEVDNGYDGAGFGGNSGNGNGNGKHREGSER